MLLYSFHGHIINLSKIFFAIFLSQELEGQALSLPNLGQMDKASGKKSL